MNLLLDTHTLIWTLADDPDLATAARIRTRFNAVNQSIAWQRNLATEQASSILPVTTIHCLIVLRI